MDSDSLLTALEVPMEYMDFLSRSWSNPAVQAFEPVSSNTRESDRSMVVQQNLANKFEIHLKATVAEKEKKLNMDNEDLKSIPPWNSDDLKSWIWLQQAMHPELNLDRCFRKKWMPWKAMQHFQPGESLKKWMKEMKQKKKEQGRLRKAEVHAAISIAGIAAALAALAAQHAEREQPNSIKETAVASAAALVAAQCAHVAESMGAKQEQLNTVVDSAMAAKNAGDIITLTAAAATSLRGAATLRARAGLKERGSRSGPITPFIGGDGVEANLGFDFGTGRAVLAQGVMLTVTTSNGKCKLRLVSVILNREAKVILKIRKITVLKAFARTKESIILDLDAWPPEDNAKGEAEPSYFIILKTTRGMIKIEMSDSSSHKLWTMTINHMLMLSTTFTGYETRVFLN